MPPFCTLVTVFVSSASEVFLAHTSLPSLLLAKVGQPAPGHLLPSLLQYFCARIAENGTHFRNIMIGGDC